MKIMSQIKDYFKFQKVNFNHSDLDEIETETAIKLSEEYKRFALSYGAVQFNNSSYKTFFESSDEKYNFRGCPS